MSSKTDQKVWAVQVNEQRKQSMVLTTNSNTRNNVIVFVSLSNSVTFGSELLVELVVRCWHNIIIAVTKARERKREHLAYF